MRRRRLLGAVAAGLAGSLSGCALLGSNRAGDGDGQGTPTSDRPLADATFAVGPTEPPCLSSGRAHYPPMSRRRTLAEEVPGETDAVTVAAFVEERIASQAPVELRSERYARIAWRDRVWTVTDRFKSEQHYVGEVQSGGGRHAIVVVLHATYTEILHFETSENC